MLDDTSPSWWYEQDGQQAGPVTAAALQRLAAEGRLGPSHRVWKNGMAGWQPISAVAELAAAIQAAQPAAPPPLAPPPALGGPGSGGGFGPPAGGFGRPAGFGGPAGAPQPFPGVAGPFEAISVGGVIGLSILTFGIYGIVKFHQTGKAYEALAGRASSFSRNFWLFVGLGVAGVVLNGASGFVGIPLTIASVVFQVLTLFEALALRDEGMRRAGVQAQVTGEGTHKALFILGLLLAPAVVGIVLLLVQAAKWFGDWNAIGAVLRPRAPGADASPAFR